MGGLNLQRWVAAFWLFGVFSICGPRALGADTIEFLNGAKLEGRVMAIDKENRRVEFEVQIAGVKRTRRYAYDNIHLVIWDGRRYEVTKRPVRAGIVLGGGNDAAAGAGVKRTPSEVRSIINAVGSTVPDWLDSTPLVYPKTLDLQWPMPAPPPWNNQRNIGQFIWDRINPNARQWRGGIRFMYFLLSRHNEDQELRLRLMRSVAAMYFRFFQDYARAAYWWEKAGVRGGDNDSAGLAECYFHLGSGEMAQRILESSGVSLAKIKLLGEMGETAKALQLADSMATWTQQSHEAYLLAGDICRRSNQFEKAILYYQKVLTGPAARNESYDKRYRGRAEDSIESIKRFELLDIKKLADGVYRGSSLAYEAPLHVEATIKNGRIEKLEITEHREKQYYSALRDVPSQILRKQSLKDVDATSRATITGVAIINATAKALTSRPRR